MAATSLGRLTLDLVAKIGNFTGPMEKAERQTKKSSESIADGFKIAGLAAQAFGAAIAGISIGGLAAFANQTINTGNEIKKFAQLSNSSIQQFQYYAKGAETAGISMESFADKMKDMQDRIGDFQQTGGGPLADFFTNIAPLVGVTIQQFQKLSGPEALQLYYDSLKKVGATQNDMKFYMEAIISDSSLLIPLLENGGEGFKRWGDAAERANAIMSDEMIENLALAKENLQLMNLQWQGLQATLVNNIVPVVQTVANNMDNIKAVAVSLTAAIAVKLIPSLVASGYQLTQLAIFSIRAGAGLASFAASAGATSGAMVALRGAMAFLGGPAGLAMLAVQGVAAGAAFLYMKKTGDEVKPSLDSQSLSVQELTANYEKLTDSAKRNQLRVESTKLSALGAEYDNAKSKLISLVVAMGRFDDSSSEAVKEANRLAMQYKQGEISAEQLASKINGLTGASAEAKTKIDAQAGAVGAAKSAMTAQERIVSALTAKNNELARSHNNAAQSAQGQATALSTLTQKQREALKGIQDQVARSRYIENNVAAGWSRAKAEAAADYRDAAGIGYARKLTEQELKTVELGFKVQQQNKAREESEKKIEEGKRKQAELAQKQYQYTSSELEMLKKVAAISSKYQLNEIGAQYGVPENLLAGIMAQESKGNTNARSQTGAIGAFQTTSIFRKQWGLTVEDSLKDIPKTAEAVAKALQQGYKEFGNWEDAITSINAGIGGTRSLNKNGFTGSAAKTKEANEYAGLVDKWYVGLSGSNSKSAGFTSEDAAESLADYQDYLSNMEQLKKEAEEKQKAITEKYLTDEARLTYEHEEAKKAIQIAYAGDDAAIAKYLALQEQAYAKDVAEYKFAQDQKRIEEQRQILEMQRGWLSAGEYARQYYALVREEILKTPGMSQERMNAGIRQANMEEGIAQYAERDQVAEQYKNRFETVNPYQQDMKLLDKSLQYNLIAEEQYHKARAQLQMQWGQSYVQGAAGVMAQVFGEQSAAYQAIFAVQKALAVAEVMMNAPKTYSAVLAAASAIPVVGPFIAPGLAAGAVAMQMAQAAMIGSVTFNPVGMAHNGIDNIPKEGTWLLDGGERVLNPKQNQDLTRYLEQANTSQQSSQSQSPQNLQINNILDPSIVGDFMGTSSGTKTFMNFIKNNRSSIKAMIA